jgi:hypothetical protein
MTQTIGCKERLVPEVIATSLAFTHGTLGDIHDFGSSVCPCPPSTIDDVLDEINALGEEVHSNLMCKIMCCCRQEPNRNRSGGPLYQNCVDQVVHNADRALGYESIYKSEISYNMHKADENQGPENTPTPFMHRVNGQDTTERSHRWQSRTQSEVEGYQPGVGMVRRPDIIVVKDPTRPPYTDNVAEVIEMKFMDDLPMDAQRRKDYIRIAGDVSNLTEMKEGKECKCLGDQKETNQVPEMLPAYNPQQESEEEKEDAFDSERALEIAQGVGAFVAGLAFLGLAAVSVVNVFDGPVGEVAATTAALALLSTSHDRIFGEPQEGGV